MLAYNRCITVLITELFITIEDKIHEKIKFLDLTLNDVTNNGSALPTGQLEALNIAASPAYRFGGLKVVQNVSTAVFIKYMLG